MKRSCLDLPVMAGWLTSMLLVSAGCTSREPMYQAIPASHWLERLADKDDNVRANAAFAIVQMRLSGPKAEDALLNSLGDKSPRVRRHVAQALGECGVAVLPRLTTALADSDQRVRATAAEALGRLGQSARPALSSLKPMLQDVDPQARLLAAWAVIRIDGETEAAQGVMVDSVSHADVEVRVAAISRLGELKIAAQPVVTALVAALKDQSTLVRREAAFCLGELGDAGAIRPLAETLSDEDQRVREAAAAVMPPLITALRNDSRSVRASAAAALGEFGPASSPTVDDLIGLLADENPMVRKTAAVSLGKIGEPTARTALLKAQFDADEEVSKAATAALERLKK